MSSLGQNKKNLIANVFTHLILIILAVTTIAPFYWMVVTSLKGTNEINAFPPTLFPHRISTKNYSRVFEVMPMFRAYFNSTYITILVTIGTLFTSSMAAFAYSKLRFRGKGATFSVLLATMMIPGQVTLIPMYIVFSKLNWVNTHIPLILPAIMINAYGVFLLKQFMDSIPDAYIEAAKIDGCNQFFSYLKICLPMCKPALVTLGLFTLVGNWNNFFGPLIYLNDENLFTVPLMISAFKGMYGVEWGLLMSASTVAVIPIIIIYLFTQKFYIQGMALSGLK